MKNKEQLYAVITGDVVNSSLLKNEQRLTLLGNMKEAFEEVCKLLEKEHLSTPFQIYRGDSFQGVLNTPEEALMASILIRAHLRKRYKIADKASWDARIAIGIGTIDFLPERGMEGDGIAFRRSGPALDSLKGENRLKIITPWDEVNKEMEVGSSFLDFVVSKWTAMQAEATVEALLGFKQQQIANNLKISQAAVNKRLKGAGVFVLQKFIERFRSLISEKLRE